MAWPWRGGLARHDRVRAGQRQLPAAGDELGSGSAISCGRSCLVCSCHLHARSQRCCGRPLQGSGEVASRRPGYRTVRARIQPLEGATCHREPSSGSTRRRASALSLRLMARRLRALFRDRRLRLPQPRREPAGGVRGDPGPEGPAGHHVRAAGAKGQAESTSLGRPTGRPTYVRRDGNPSRRWPSSMSAPLLHGKRSTARWMSPRPGRAITWPRAETSAGVKRCLWSKVVVHDRGKRRGCERLRRPDAGPGTVPRALRPWLRGADPIQRAAIPPLLEGRDLVGQAATGTGRRPPSRFRPPADPREKAGGQSRWPWCSSRRASSRCRSPRRCTATGTTWARVSCRSTAASHRRGSCGRSIVAST